MSVHINCKKGKKLDHNKFHSYNDDPWKMIDHVVMFENTCCEMVNLHPNDPSGVMGVSTPCDDEKMSVKQLVQFV